MTEKTVEEKLSETMSTLGPIIDSALKEGLGDNVKWSMVVSDNNFSSLCGNTSDVESANQFSRITDAMVEKDLITRKND